jgi:hypothetical protein
MRSSFLPRRLAGFFCGLDPAQQEALTAIMVEAAIRYHNEKRGGPGRESVSAGRPTSGLPDSASA